MAFGVSPSHFQSNYCTLLYWFYFCSSFVFEKKEIVMYHSVNAIGSWLAEKGELVACSWLFNFFEFAFSIVV